MRTISEATNLGSVVANVAATDADVGLNSKLKYSILPNNYSSKKHIQFQFGFSPFFHLHVFFLEQK